MRFNSPPGWPPPPPDWAPDKDWVPDPTWPAAPEGWQFWVEPGFEPPRSSRVPTLLGVLALVVVLVFAGAAAWHFAKPSAPSNTGSSSVATDDTSMPAGDVLAYSPDGSLLAIAGDRKVRFWNPARRQVTGQPLAVPDGVTRMAFAPDGLTLAVLCLCGGNYGLVTLWEIPTGRRLGELPSGEPDYELAIASNGLLTTGSVDGDVQLWDSVTRGQVGTPLTGHSGNLLALAFSPDGNTLATAGTDSSLFLWDTAGHRQIAEIVHGHSGNVNALAFSPDGRTLASASFDGTVQLWDTATRRRLGAPIIEPGPVFLLAFSPDGRELATAGQYNGAKLWNVATRREIAGALAGSAGWVDSLAFSPDGKTLATTVSGVVELSTVPPQ